MSSPKIIDLYRDFAAVFICLRPRTPSTLRVYSILIHIGKGWDVGRVDPVRRLEGEQFTKLGRNYQHD